MSSSENVSPLSSRYAFASKKEKGNTSNSTVLPVNKLANSPDNSVELLPVTKIDTFSVALNEANAFSKFLTCCISSKNR